MPSTALVMTAPRISLVATARRTCASRCSTILRRNNQPLFARCKVFWFDGLAVLPRLISGDPVGADRTLRWRVEQADNARGRIARDGPAGKQRIEAELLRDEAGFVH